MRVVTAGLLIFAALPVVAQDRRLSRDFKELSNSMAPYVASPQPIVDRMLDAAALKPGELIYDLGCGDGRVLITAAQRYKAKGVGVELSEKLVRSTSEDVKRRKLDDMIQIMHGNLMDVDLGKADVVTIY